MAGTNTLVFNTTVAKHSNLVMELDIARQSNYGAIEITANKVREFLASGRSREELARALDGLSVYGVGTIIDIERHGPDHAALLTQAKEVLDIAAMVGARGVQVINGPLDYKAVEAHRAGRPMKGYSGVLAYDREEQVSITARNLALLADMARERNIVIYLEALAWSPLNTLKDQIELLDKADRENLKMVIDYWHCYTSGDTPEDVTRIARERIFGVHVCDALKFEGGVPNEVLLRDVPTGQGVLDLKEWTDAVKATGYNDWWSSETFCKKQQQDDCYAVSKQLHAQLENLVLA
ncbi:sugar phosphate isomerase/epimerase family protein [Rhizobium sp. BK060]|uniref:sugar phosphate isomerase/epimerase family protein n=1 Tax=Rhizobium sp. BK060 TaxID=2587096 RepID=UPI0016228FF2|nr:sugar phosphate isomerase/epimerase family protein [Rhizobium sp. BK060]MBB3396009.1 sugar phosphate isomerase/epimerase [Rhizobium sp. BK060]